MMEAAIKEIKDLCTLKGALEKDIIMAEKKLGISFAKDYRKYLSKYGAISGRGIELTGLNIIGERDVVKKTLKERKEGTISSDVYVIEDLEIAEILIVQNELGEIFETDKNGNIEKIYDELREYIRKR